jgi:hypothetical protein
MAGSTATLNLIATIIGLAAQFGPPLVKGIIDLIHGNPQQQGETDDAYIARINALSDAKLADAERNDAEVEAS